MIDYNLARFSNSPANLEHVTLNFDNLVDKYGTYQRFSKGFFTPLWINVRPSGSAMVSLRWNLCVQRKNQGSMTRRRTRMPTLGLSPGGLGLGIGPGGLGLDIGGLGLFQTFHCPLDDDRYLHECCLERWFCNDLRPVKALSSWTILCIKLIIYRFYLNWK